MPQTKFYAWTQERIIERVKLARRAAQDGPRDTDETLEVGRLGTRTYIYKWMRHINASAASAEGASAHREWGALGLARIALFAVSFALLHATRLPSPPRRAGHLPPR